jgi:hypothetical protein
MASYFTKENC